MLRRDWLRIGAITVGPVIAALALSGLIVASLPLALGASYVRGAR